tara:strand:- start:1959 stop:2390 length:432 start_codon:yes stop_codon:yes gene_type:complete
MDLNLFKTFVKTFNILCMKNYIILILFILVSCNKYKEQSIIQTEIPIDKIESNTIIIKQEYIMSNSSYVESSIINKFDYNSQNSFTKVDTVLLEDYLKLDISADGEVNGSIKLSVVISDTIYEFEWLKIFLNNKIYSNTFLIN